MTNSENKIMSDSKIEIALGLVAVIALYVWKHDSISSMWRFYGMVAITLISGLIAHFLIAFLSRWKDERAANKRNLEMIRSTGVSDNYSSSSEMGIVWRYMLSRYSTELFCNRMTDFIGSISLITISLISVSITTWYFVMVGYLAWYGYYDDYIFLWLPLVCHIFVAVISMVLNSACNLIFNRYPGEAKRFNKKYELIRASDELISSKEFRESLH